MHPVCCGADGVVTLVWHMVGWGTGGSGGEGEVLPSVALVWMLPFGSNSLTRGKSWRNLPACAINSPGSADSLQIQSPSERFWLRWSFIYMKCSRVVRGSVFSNACCMWQLQKKRRAEHGWLHLG
jgi:hypothetical protein